MSEAETYWFQLLSMVHFRVGIDKNISICISTSLSLSLFSLHLSRSIGLTNVNLFISIQISHSKSNINVGMCSVLCRPLCYFRLLCLQLWFKKTFVV